MKYKEGDKVRIKSIDWYNKYKNEDGDVSCGEFNFVEGMKKFCSETLTISEDAGDGYLMLEDYNGYVWTDEMIEGLVEEGINVDVVVEETTKDISDKVVDTIMGGLMEGRNFNLPEGYIFKDENGNIINATKIVLEKKKKEYPKTFEECVHVLEGENRMSLEQMNTFRKLIDARNAYWKIYGEENGLGKPWEPDWNIRGYYAIARSYGNVVKTSNYNCDLTFVFPTEEMRDAFYENFKELINECKELL